MKFILIISICLLGNFVNAQRQMSGQRGIELTGGLIPGKKPAKNFYYLQAGVAINGSKGNYQLYGLEYSRKMRFFEDIAIPVETYLAEGGYHLYVAGDWARNVSLMFGLSATMGYENINKGESALSNGALLESKSGFVYGGGMRLSLETYLGNRLLLLFQGKCRYLGGTSVEHLRPGVGLGIRYQF